MHGKLSFETFSERMGTLYEQALEEISFGTDMSVEWTGLTAEQTELLERNGCACDDWSRVMVSPGSETGCVRDCRFSGEVYLSLLPASINGTDRNPLLLGSNFSDVTVGPGCRVLDTGLVEGMVLQECVTLERCGRISYEQGSLPGCLQSLELGVETGERNVPSFPLLDIETAALLSGDGTRRMFLDAYVSMVNRFAGILGGMGRGLLCRECCISDTGVVENSLIGPGAEVRNATAVINSMLLEGASVRNGALVRDSILKWDAMADSLAIVDGSVLDEASTVEKHGKLTASFLGPNSVLGEGEITASLAGPFTACHHQALLIAARWPEGRGNLGYGANVGSNHTSRLPDQEIRPGEGMFFGLACSVKFPADFSMAPYTIIATGVTTLPQRVEFPFSLICEPFLVIDDVPPAWNQIIPGWVLSDNMFAVLRNDAKYRERNRARRWDPPDMPIIRAGTVEMMLEALVRLDVGEAREYYTEREIGGLGKNFMTEAHRVAAMETYRFHSDLFALNVACSHTAAEGDRALASRIMGERYSDLSLSRLNDLRESMQERLARASADSRSRDHRRGGAVISDYRAVRNPEGN